MNDIMLDSNATIKDSSPLNIKNGLKTKTPPVFSRLEIITAALMLPLGYLYIKLILNPAQAGIGATLFTLLFVGAMQYWQRGQQLSFSRDSLIYLGLILLTAAYFPLFDNSTLKAQALLLLHLLVGYYVATISGIRLENRLGAFLPFDLLDALIMRPFGNLFNGPAALFSGTRNARTMRSALLLLLGMLLAIPACVAVSYMLQTADAAFDTLWHNLTSAFLTDRLIENIFQFLISLPIGCYLFAMLYGSKEKACKKEKVSGFAQRMHFIPGLLAIGGITPLLLIYVIFFCSQSAYFLSAFSGLLPEGYIYSEYARRGFFELCRISSLNFAVILGLQLLCKKEGGLSRIYRLYTVALSLTSVALIVISLRKMLLYIQIFGLTPLRLYTSWFMILLALVFIFVIVKTYRPSFNVVKWSSVLAVTMFLLLAFANPDARIASYNVNAYTEGRLEQLDVINIGNLGAAATPYLQEIATGGQFGPSNRAEAQMILDRRTHLAQTSNEDWRSFNLAAWKSNNQLLENL